MSPGETQIEYFVVSYFPDALTERRYTLALIICEKSGSETSNIVARVNPDVEGVRRIDPDANIEMLDLVVKEIEKQFQSRETGEKFLQLMLQSFSNVVRISEKRKSAFVGNRDFQIDALCKHYLV